MDVFNRQDGLATVAQLRGVGVTRGAIRGRVARGEWEQWDERVIGVAGVAHTWRRQVRAAALSTSPCGAISHETAARLHRFDGFARAQAVHVTVCGGRHLSSVPGVIVHRSRLLAASACPAVDGILVVPKPLALIQVTAAHGEDAGRQALDGLLRDGARPAWIHHVATQWRRPGVPGPALALDLLHAATAARLPASWFQRLASRLLAERGLALVDEFPVSDAEGMPLARLDLAMPDLKVGVECQSWEWHGTPSARRKDALRKRQLRLIGWEIIDVWWSDLERMDGVFAELDVVLAARRASGSRGQ
jgi:very-short-patch-repair endonuclease